MHLWICLLPPYTPALHQRQTPFSYMNNSMQIGEGDMCQVCNIRLTNLSLHEKQMHYERHFSDTIESPRESSRIRGLLKFNSPPSSSTSQLFPEKENIFWHPSKDYPPPSNFTPGLIQILERALSYSHAQGTTTRAALSHEGVVHIASGWDRGWGCGYRNFLMACTALIEQSAQPLYFPALDLPNPPGIRNLQAWIEESWRQGFDSDGAEQLKHKLVGTRKWIGTGEIYVAFTHRGIPARLVDFPEVAVGGEVVTHWVEQYFTSPHIPGQVPAKPHDVVYPTADGSLHSTGPVLCTGRMPLILQHSGHSRTVVGFEKCKNGTVNLLVFDPSKSLPTIDIYFASADLGTSTEDPRMQLEEQHSLPGHLENVLSNILHPLYYDRFTGKAESSGSASHFNKRCASSSPSRGSSATINAQTAKRARGRYDDGDVAIIGDKKDAFASSPRTSTPPVRPKNHAAEDNLDMAKVLDFFRVNSKSLGKNNRYQILYFPMDPLLSAEQRWAQRVVTATRVVS